MKEFLKRSPYFYIYGEIRLTYTKTGDQIVLILGTYSDKKIKNLRFNQPLKEKNITNEKTDSISHPSSSIYAFIYENNLLKVANQMHVIEDLISNGGRYFIGGFLTGFLKIYFIALRFLFKVKLWLANEFLKL